MRAEYRDFCLVTVLLDVAGSGRVACVPRPPEKKQIDKGRARTIEFYRANLPKYVEGG